MDVLPEQKHRGDGNELKRKKPEEFYIDVGYGAHVNFFAVDDLKCGEIKNFRSQLQPPILMAEKTVAPMLPGVSPCARGGAGQHPTPDLLKPAQTPRQLFTSVSRLNQFVHGQDQASHSFYLENITFAESQTHRFSTKRGKKGSFLLSHRIKSQGKFHKAHQCLSSGLSFH